MPTRRTSMAGQDGADGCIAPRRLGADTGYAGRALGDAVGIEQRLGEFLFDGGLQRHIQRRTGDVKAAQASAGQAFSPAVALYSNRR